MSFTIRLEPLLISYSRWLVNHAWFVMAATVVASLVMSLGAFKLGFDTDFRAYFGKGNPELQVFDQLQSDYAVADNVFIGIEPQNGDVFEPEILLAIRELTTAAWAFPYSARVDSLTNHQHVETLGDDINVTPLLSDSVHPTAEIGARIRRIALQEPALLRRLVSPDGRMAGINVINEFSGPSAEKQKAAVLAARNACGDIEKKHPSLHCHVTGSTAMSYAFTEASMRDMSTLAPAMYVLSFLVMFVLLRSVKATLATLFMVLLASTSAMGVAGYAGVQLTPPVVAAPLIISVLAIADAVHICLTLLSQMRKGLARKDAIVESLRLNFVPIFLTNATTSICFLGTNFTDSPPLTLLGNISSLGGLLSWLLSMTLLPASLAVLPLKSRGNGGDWLKPALDRLARLVMAKHRVILASTIGLSVALSCLATLNDTNDRFLHYLEPSSKFRADSDKVMNGLTGIYSIEYSLRSTATEGVTDPLYLQKIDAFSEWWKNGPYRSHVVYVGSVADIFKRLNQAMHADSQAMHKLPDDPKAAAQYLLLFEMSLPFGHDLNDWITVDKSASRMSVVLDDVGADQVREMEAAGNAWLLDNAPTLHAKGTGTSVMFSHIAERNIRSNFQSLPLSLAAISLLLLPGLRSAKLGLLSLIPNLLPLGMAFGIWALMDGQIIFTMAVVLNVVVGIVVDDTIHFLEKYQRARRNLAMHVEEAIRYAYREAGAAMIANTLILEAGFLVMAQSTFEPNATMAQLAAITVFVAWPIDLLVLPGLLVLIDGRRNLHPNSLMHDTTHANPPRS